MIGNSQWVEDIPDVDNSDSASDYYSHCCPFIKEKTRQPHELPLLWKSFILIYHKKKELDCIVQQIKPNCRNPHIKNVSSLNRGRAPVSRCVADHLTRERRTPVTDI